MADDINSIIVALDRHINSGEAPPSSVYIPEQSESNVDADEPDEQSSSPTPSSPSGESNLDTSSSSAGATATTTNSAPIGAPDSTKENGSPNPARRIKHVAFLSQESTESSRSRAKEEPLDQESLLIAATLIQDAKEGRNLVYILSEKTVRAYIVYNNKWLRWLLYFTIFLVLALALFEEPAVTGLGLPYWGTMLMEFPCLVYFAVRMCHAMSFQQRDVFFKDAKNITIIVVLLLSFLDMMCYIIWENLAKSGHPIRWSRFLRPLFIINFPDGKQIRRAFRNIRRTVPDIMNVLILFLLSVLLFGLLALKLFYRRDIHYPDGTSYFSNYLDAIWDLYVLVTTANNPDVMMPAYNRNNWFAIFFIVYIILCLYIFMSIVLAAIYNNYRKNLKNEIKSAVLMKRQRLGKAFDLLKVRRGDEDVISHSRWRQLTSVLLPTKSEVYSDLMMKILDDDNTSVLSKKNFLNVSDLLNVHLSEVKDRITLQEKLFPKIYNHPWSVNFKFMVRHKFFRYIFDFMIGVNALFIAIDLDVADWFFLSIFTFEILCNLYVAGFKEYFQRFWYTFDFLIIGSAFCASVIERIMGRTDDELRTLDVLLVLRVLRLVKIFGSIKRFKVILQTLLNIGTSIITYGGVIFVFFYSFAIIGMELFSGLISYYGYDAESQASAATAFCGNAKLNNSLFYSFHYCGNNFNNILKALMVMFELMVVNQWHVLTSGFVLVTSKAARLYFFTFHMCTVVIVLNIFTAFILEAFILEYTLQTVPKLESVVEAKIKELGLGIGMRPRKMSIQGPSGDTINLVDEAQPPAIDPEVGSPPASPATAPAEEADESDDDTLPDLSKERGFKFHLRKRSRKKVEVLLEQMFQGELGDLDEEPENLEAMENFRRSRKPTLEEIA